MNFGTNLRSPMWRIGVSAFAILQFGSVATADEAKTYGEAFNVPVFESIDGNGVNLITGQLQVVSPTITRGGDESRVTVGMRWTGRGWTMLGVPQIWRKDGVYTVVYNGAAEEFNGRGQNYSQRKPITGSKLSCSIFEPGDVATECQYTNRNGDVVHFRGMYAPQTPYPGGYGMSGYMFGNLGMSEAQLYSFDSGFTIGGWTTPLSGGFQVVSLSNDRLHRRYWGQATIGGLPDPAYNKREYTIKSQGETLLITTPNHDGTDSDEHFLLPKGTTQTITDDLGATWAYTINSDREMTLIDPPGNAANISIGYNSNHKVSSVTNADGTWIYSYGSGTTTVTNPLGEVTFVRYNTDKDYVTEARDGNNRTTYYGYDSGDRLSSVTFPEGNSVSYIYDARGNITQETQTPKAGQGTPINRYAGYPATCTNPVLCNLPIYVIDGKNNRTDFEYAPTTSIAVESYPYSQANFSPVVAGTRKPTRILLPPDANNIRREIRNSYQDGILVQSAECRTTGNCVGTSDEVVTQYDYGGTTASHRLSFGKSVSAGGVTLRSCYSYDFRGQMVGETPPNAGITACPTTLSSGLSVTAIAPTIANSVSAPTYPP